MNEIKVGDYVKIENVSNVGRVGMALDDSLWVTLPEVGPIFVTDLTKVTKIDPKTAFLTELKALLTKYNAEIVASKWQKDADTIKPLMQIDIKDEKSITYENEYHNEYVYLNASNIMDFDKE